MVAEYIMALGTLLAPPSNPAGYSRDVAPVLAMRCSRCHGDQGAPSGGLDTRSWAGLKDVVEPGDPDRSLLVEFIEGRRGPQHRMPLGEPPLPPTQIASIRRWIAEGAREDADTSPVVRRTAPAVRVHRGRPLQVVCRSPVDAYLVLLVIGRGRVLHREAAPGREARWTILPAHNWPRHVTLDLEVRYASPEAAGATLEVR
jgi:hypothetical protein